MTHLVLVIVGSTFLPPIFALTWGGRTKPVRREVTAGQGAGSRRCAEYRVLRRASGFFDVLDRAMPQFGSQRSVRCGEVP